MKKTMWLTIAAASAATAFYVIKKYISSSKNYKQPGKMANKHHRTTVFSRAKQHALSDNIVS